MKKKSPFTFGWRRAMVLLLPVLLGVLLGFLWQGLNQQQTIADKDFPLAGRELPALSLRDMTTDKVITNKDIINSAQGRVVVINVFASWCAPCIAEMPTLKKLKEQDGTIMWVGINWQDEESSAKQFLRSNPNPYNMVLQDIDGKAMFGFGLIGVPETYVVDKNGIMRSRHIGAIINDQMAQEFLQKIKKWQ